MLNFNELSKLLDESDEDFVASRDEADTEASAYSRMLRRLPGLDVSVLEAPPARTGARPLEAFGDSFIVPFAHQWEDRDACLSWMDGVLKNSVVAAVDGGQIYPERGTGVPVAVLQSGMAVNDRGGGLRRQGRLRIIGPHQFTESIFTDTPFNGLVDAGRFELECDSAVEVMEESDDVTVLMDYPLLVPHLMGYQDRLRYTYLHAAKRLLRASEASGNPVVGFIDRSVSRDLTTFLFNLSASSPTPSGEPLPRPRWTYDSRLLRKGARWGTRTRVMLLDRDDRRGGAGTASLDLYDEMGDRLCFFYLCTDGVSFSRVELPRFVYDSGRLDSVVEVLLAQTVLRGHYPDILHQAHRAASITRGDQELFGRMFRRYCREKGLEPDGSWKQMHKTLGQRAGRRWGR